MDVKKDEAKLDFQIVEFESKYQDQVIKVIGNVLMDLEVIPKSTEPLKDEDLYNIPETYKNKGRFWVAIHNNKVIGTVAIRDMGGLTAKLNRMFVLTKYHGTGVGQALFDTAINFAKRNGYKEVILNTHLLMKRAHHFYEKNGFRKVAEDIDKYHYRLEL